MDKDNQLKSFLYQVKPNARQKRARMNEINWSAYNLSADSAWVIGINNHGEVSGEFSMPLPMVPGQSNHRQVGFVMDGDSLSPIDPPANCFAASSATGVNNKGQIAGWYFCSEPFGWHGFLSHDMGDTFTIFDYPGTLGTTIANGINAKGQVVGNYNDSLGTHGFVYDNGQFKAIDVPGARQTVANGINKQGVVVGYYALRW
jgi:probable HAF family extracellular repeat protein